VLVFSCVPFSLAVLDIAEFSVIEVLSMVDCSVSCVLSSVLFVSLQNRIYVCKGNAYNPLFDVK